jgi:hypothetical protein
MTTLNATRHGADDLAMGVESAMPTLAETARVRRQDERAFALLLLLSYPFFLLLAIGARLVRSGSGEGASVFSVAAEAARSTLAIALNQ